MELPKGPVSTSFYFSSGTIGKKSISSLSRSQCRAVCHHHGAGYAQSCPRNQIDDRMTNSTTSTWTGMVPVDDAALAVTDTRGPGRPVVYLNGAYASQRHWRPVIAELGTNWRHITYDERARGRSKRSADYSFAACLRDVDAVLEATGVDRPLLVGWSYGAAVAVHWAERNPGRILGVVSVDGAV